MEDTVTAEVVSTLPETCRPAVWLWPGHAVYSGPSLQLGHHSGSVWCLAVGVDADLTVTTARGSVVVRSAFVPPRVRHRLDTHGGRLVAAYLDPTSGRAATCRAACRVSPIGVFADHDARRALTTMPGDLVQAQRWLDEAAPAAPRSVDPRVSAAAKRLRDALPEAPSVGELAAEAGLSESRFMHVFRRDAGTSVRRYRIWARLMSVGAAVAAGRTLTDASADAGFASPSHLSDTFRATFGLSATQLLASGVAIVTGRPGDALDVTLV